MKTKTEIILETKEAYSDPQNRGFDGICEYLTDDGRMCAIGRVCLKPEKLPDGSLSYYTYIGKWQISEIEWSDDLLKEEYRGHSVEFWEALQLWHDLPANFDPDRISKQGEEEINGLLEVWK